LGEEAAAAAALVCIVPEGVVGHAAPGLYLYSACSGHSGTFQASFAHLLQSCLQFGSQAHSASSLACVRLRHLEEKMKAWNRKISTLEKQKLCLAKPDEHLSDVSSCHIS
jgi:hypothetical protein